MKRDKVSTFFKSKGFYVSLFSGIAAVFVLTMTYANRESFPQQGVEEAPDQVEMPGQVADVDPVGQGAVGVKPDVQAEQPEELTDGDDTIGAGNPEEIASTEQPDEPEGELAADLTDEDGTESAEVPSSDEGQELAAGPELESEYGEVTQPVTSVNESQNALQNLTFNEETGLLWPAEGPIIKNYSVEKLVYFDTLNQYKWNPAVMISLEAGSDVLCGAKGVVTAIGKTEELGNSVLVDIGDGYQLKYAQLQDLQVQVGDLVEEGQVLAQVAEPTIYYNEEGSNLYFQVLQDGETVNPLLLLR